MKIILFWITFFKIILNCHLTRRWAVLWHNQTLKQSCGMICQFMSIEILSNVLKMLSYPAPDIRDIVYTHLSKPQYKWMMWRNSLVLRLHLFLPQTREIYVLFYVRFNLLPSTAEESRLAERNTNMTLMWIVHTGMCVEGLNMDSFWGNWILSKRIPTKNDIKKLIHIYNKY